MRATRVLVLVMTMLGGTAAVGAEAGPRQVLDLSDEGWRLCLDREAAWKDDRLHLPPGDVSSLPVNPPTGGWSALDEKSLAVSVPGTVEEYLFDEIGDYVGVSWWWRWFTPPADLAGKRIILQFEAVRLRAEVFLGERLVGYDAVGNTPFEVDVTGLLKPGEKTRLAVRVTDPSGNFDWVDYLAHHWGKQPIPASHGFGGVTGPVRLLAVSNVHVADVFVKNKPAMTEVDLEITLRNAGAAAVAHDLSIQICEAAADGKVVFEQSWPEEAVPPGERVVTRTVSVSEARPWSPDSPSLYVCRVSLGEVDRSEVRFGFRWFAPEGFGQDAVFRLNGKRIVLRSAISWGFWPTNGIFPTPELAEKNIRTAKALGLNMLNWHRCIGTPLSFDKADELGLLIFEEPGGYTSRGGDESCFALAREKLLRMVRRDRNRPSLVMYNMINEEQAEPQARHRRDMADAHRLDPTRTITYTSGWAKEGDDPIKLHMRPYDDQQYLRGWFDYHHATGPGAYRDAFCEGPGSFRLRTENRQEIVFWGEEGANATPPRLELIHQALEGRPNGWDGAAYRQWHDAYARYLDEKKLREFFPTVDALTLSMGDISYEYQGRIIENIRMGNVTDGYVVNGWECEKLENHSGVVDTWRNPKGHVERLARFNAPLYVAVKLRNRVAATPAAITADYYIVNEVDLKGRFHLSIVVNAPSGNKVWSHRLPVTVSGGEVYGELLVDGLGMIINHGPGRYIVEAVLAETSEQGGVVSSREVARGSDEFFLVDWAAQRVPSTGAILESNGRLRGFLKAAKSVDLPEFRHDLPPLKYILIGETQAMPKAAAPADCFLLPDRDESGLAAEYYRGKEFNESLLQRKDDCLDFAFGADGPDASLDGGDYSVRWQGRLRVPESGAYVFHVSSDDGARFWLDGELLVDAWSWHFERWDTTKAIELESGKDYPLRVEFCKGGGRGVLRLHWTTPAELARGQTMLDDILCRVRDDGTTAVFLAQTHEWATRLGQRRVISYRGAMEHGIWWLGGCFFVREYPLFDGLPVNQGMNWEYQELVNYGRRRYGLLLDGEEAVVGCVDGHEHRVATAVAVLPHGRGRLVLSTLDLLPVLDGPPGPADVARKILCNYLDFAGKQP